VEKVVFGTDGLLAGAHAGMAYFDLSTNSQAMVRRVNAALAEKKAFGFDAPVSGGPKGAETGKLAIWVSGDKAVYDKHKPVLDAIGDQAAYIGLIGSATVAKLVHNMAGTPSRPRWPRSSPWARRLAWIRRRYGRRCARVRKAAAGLSMACPGSFWSTHTHHLTSR